MHRTGRTTLGIVTVAAEGIPGVVLLDFDPMKPSPTFQPTGSYDVGFVLSHGHDYAFSVSSDRMLTSFEPGFGENGLMLVSPDHVSIRVRSLFPGVDSGFFNITTGMMASTERPSSERWALLDWEIRLNSMPADAPPLYKFKFAAP
jgi:hypothetical protein